MFKPPTWSASSFLIKLVFHLIYCFPNIQSILFRFIYSFNHWDSWTIWTINMLPDGWQLRACNPRQDAISRNSWTLAVTRLLLDPFLLYDASLGLLLTKEEIKWPKKVWQCTRKKTKKNTGIGCARCNSYHGLSGRWLDDLKIVEIVEQVAHMQGDS